MKQATTIGVFALLANTEAGKARDEHPVQKIITLLKGLESQAVEEGKSEALSMQKFEYWCKNSKKELSKAIAEEKDNIDSLESKISAKAEESKTLGEQIGELEKEIGELQTSAKEALTASDKANALYETASTDLQSTIDSVGECITAIKDSKDETSFIAAQKKGSALISLLETDPVEVMAAGDMQAHKKSYSFKGGNILELLKQLELKFEDDLTRTEKEETNRVNAYNLAKDARDNAITAAEKSRDDKTQLKGEVDEELEQAKSDLKDENDELTADSGTLDSTSKKCSVKNSEWEERSATRSGEIEAINVAIKILAKVADVRTEAPSNPIPPASPMFLQTGNVVNDSDPKMKAVIYLRQQAKTLHQKALERLAQQVSAHLNGPFDDVNQMIEKMIFRLMAEQKDEDDHKNWCDLELEKTQTSLDDKFDKMEGLQKKIDDTDATIGDLTEEIKAADDMVADIIAFMKEATEIREVGKQENALAIKDAQDSQEAVSNAIAVLTDFYKESGEVAKEPWEFLQRGVKLPEDPETWDSSYTGVADPTAQPGGIITVLEKCNEDFATMEADTKAQEASDQDAFDSDMAEHDIEKSKRSKESEMKVAEKKRLVEKSISLNKNRKHVADEHEATEQYQKDLQPACVEGDSTYEERKQARADESEALHKAQVILEDAFKEKDGGFLQRKINKL